MRCLRCSVSQYSYGKICIARHLQGSVSYSQGGFINHNLFVLSMAGFACNLCGAIFVMLLMAGPGYSRVFGVFVLFFGWVGWAVLCSNAPGCMRARGFTPYKITIVNRTIVLLRIKYTGRGISRMIVNRF